MFTETQQAMFWPPQSLTLALNVKDYGAVGDGIHDDTATIASARSAANSAGGGIVFYPGGTYLTGNQPIYSNVIDTGAGTAATIIKLKNGANADLFSGQTSLINLSASYGTGSVGSLSRFGWSNLTLDGNKANQSSGPSYPIRVYGYGFFLENVVLRNGYSGGILCDWNGGNNVVGTDNMEARWKNVISRDHFGEYVTIGGPHDSQIVNITCFNLDGSTHSHLFHACPNAGGLQISNIHCYGSYGGSACPGLMETKVYISNGEFESTDFYCLVLLGPGSTFSGTCYSSNYAGIKLGQNSGETPIPGQILQSAGVTTYQGIINSIIDVVFNSITGSKGCLVFPGGGAATQNIIRVTSQQASGVLYSGYADSTNTITSSVPIGLAPDGSAAKGGYNQIDANSPAALVVSDGNYTDVFALDTHNKLLQLLSATALQLYSDQYSTLKMELNKTGNGEVLLGNSSSLYSGSGGPSNSLGSNGDFYFRTDTPGLANQRIYVKSAGSWTGVV